MTLVMRLHLSDFVSNQIMAKAFDDLPLADVGFAVQLLEETSMKAAC